MANTTYTITIAKVGNGTLTPTAGTYTYDSGTAVTLTAVADAGYSFASWSDGGDAKHTITVTESKTYTATFTVNNYTIYTDTNTIKSSVIQSASSGLMISPSINLNSQWVLGDKNPDPAHYIQYMSNSNLGVASGYASMIITVCGITSFTIYINSYAESSFDYTIAWNADVAAPTSLPSSSTTGVKAHTESKQYDPYCTPSLLSTNYTAVEYSLDGLKHTICITYRKDSSANRNYDRGYVLIPRGAYVCHNEVFQSATPKDDSGNYKQCLLRFSHSDKGHITYDTGLTYNNAGKSITITLGSMLNSWTWTTNYAYRVGKDFTFLSVTLIPGTIGSDYTIQISSAKLTIGTWSVNSGDREFAMPLTNCFVTCAAPGAIMFTTDGVWLYCVSPGSGIRFTGLVYAPQ